MANIPAERTGVGTPWWVWLLGLLVLAGGIWLVAELFDNDPDADEIAGTDDNVGVIDDFEIEPGADEVDGDVVTTEDQLYADDDGLFETDAEMGDGAGGRDDPGDPIAEAGRMEGVTVTRLEPGTAVDLNNVPVLNVIGDSAFWIGRDDMRRYLVVLAGLGESETGAGGSDGVFNVDEGDTVSIDGAIARYLDGERGLSELTDVDTEALRQQNAYIRVNSASDITVGG